MTLPTTGAGTNVSIGDVTLEKIEPAAKVNLTFSKTYQNDRPNDDGCLWQVQILYGFSRNKEVIRTFRKGTEYVLLQDMLIPRNAQNYLSNLL